MALPKLNDTPKFNVTIPSTNQKVRFRPYLVKEEKVLMMAIESGDSRAALAAVVDTIDACILEDINIRKLSTFDVEYLFTQIRSKSAGENVNIGLKCKSCDHVNEIQIPLDLIKIKVPKVQKLHELTDNISIELRYPPYKILLDMDLENTSSEQSFALAAKCIEAIIHDDERISCDDTSDEEMIEFLESMTKEQFETVSNFIETMPKLQHDVKFDCVSCQKKNNIKIEGIQSFF
jgi:hypothetical protein